MASNLGTIRTLVALRYRLLWAQARTGKGRIALFLTLYLVGGGIAIFFVLGGFGAALLAVQTGKAEALTRAVLSGIFLNGIVASLALGIGPRAAFADRVLRRFPLTPAQRFSARHMIGVLDPLWLFLTALTLGLAAGLVALGAGSLVLAVPAALLFICVTYLVAALLLTVVERILQHRGGELLLTVVLLAAYVAFALGLPLLLQMKSRAAWWPGVDRVLQYTPAGSAAALLASGAVLHRVLAVLALAAWGTALWLALRTAENWTVGRVARAVERISWDSAYDALGRMIFPAQGPLVARALRYHLRCNRVRYQLAISVPLILFLEVMFRFQRLGPESRGMATLGFVFMLGIFSTLAMAVNEFGYDGAGVRRYALLPLPMSTALRAQARTSIFLSLCAIIPGTAVWCLMRGSTLDWRGVVFVVGDAMAGLLLFGAAGLWTTVLTPKRAEFDRVMGNDMSLGGNIILFACIFVMSAMGPLAHHRRLADLLGYWWVMLLGAAAMAIVYLASLLLAGRLLDARRERVIETIAGAAQN